MASSVPAEAEIASGAMAVEEQGQPFNMQLSEKQAQDPDVPGAISGDEAPSLSGDNVDGAAEYDPGAVLQPGLDSGEEEDDDDNAGNDDDGEDYDGGDDDGEDDDGEDDGVDEGNGSSGEAQTETPAAQAPPPPPQAPARRPKAVGGFLVGDSDSEDGGSSTPAARLANNGQSSAAPAQEPPSDPYDPADLTVHDAAAPQPLMAAAPDTVQALEARIANDPRGAMDAWLALIDEHRKNNRFNEAKSVFARFLDLFPQAAEIWVGYIEMELELQNFKAAEELFGKSLTQVANVPLWVVYLDYVRRRNNLNDAGASEARTVVSQAYEFVLDHVGLDRDAGQIWQDYVQFIRSGPGTIGGSSWQDQQKMDQLRKAFRRATSVPIANVNQLWREYDQFEMGLNKITGRKFLAERSPAYMSAKSANTAMDNLTRGLSRTTIPRLPPVAGFEGHEEYMSQLDLWRKWIAWEKGDPLDLGDDEPEVLKARILYCYKQALMPMRYWPELWVEAAEWCFENGVKEGSKDKGLDFLVQGIVANPESILLALKHADRIESTYPTEEGDAAKIARGQAVREPYDKITKTLRDRHKALQDSERAEVARIEESFAASNREAAATKRGSGGDDDDDADDDDAYYNGGRGKDSASDHAKMQKIALIKQGFAAQMDLVSKCLTHVWIALARAMRRIQGKGSPQGPLGGLRQVFYEARKGGRLKSDIYVAVAKMEWKCYNDKAGGKIFERGSKLFPEDPYFMIEYIKYLTAHGDNTNSRVVFETCVNKLAQKPETVHKAKPLLAYMHKREAEFGDLARVAELEKRMTELYPDDPKLALFSKRFTTEKFDPVGARIIVSPAAQLRPRLVLPSVEKQPPSLRNSPMPGFGSGLGLRPQGGASMPSPKRPYATDDYDDHNAATSNPPRKILRAADQREFQRAESPLKGAAGRRLDQRRLQGHSTSSGYGAAASTSGPPTLPTMVNFLLGQIPPAGQYNGVRYPAAALVHLLRETNIDLNGWELGGGGGGGGRRSGKGGNGRSNGSGRHKRGGSRNSPARSGYRQSSLRPDTQDDSYEPPGAVSGFDYGYRYQ